MRYRDIAAQHSVSEKTDSNSYLLQLERDTRAGMLILHILDKNTGKRTEVRGKMGYETNGYDPEDKLHQLLDKVGKSASISDLMNGDVVSINPRHPDAKQAQSAADTAYDEDQHPNDTPRGPETKPTMPSGTIRVKVSDVYDWYKLGQHISDLKGLGKHDFGKGPPEAVISFGSEEQEHKYIELLKQLGLEILDVDPKAADVPGVKTDPTYNTESFDTDVEWVSDLNSRNVQVFATKIDDAYIELTYKRVFPADVYISFTRGGRMSVTGEGSQNKIFGAVINHVKQWVAKNKPPRIIFSAFKPNTGPFGSQDTTRSGLYSKMVQRFAGQSGYDFDVENAGSEDTFILTKKQQPTQTTESLDQPYPYSWGVQSEDEWVARARTDSGAILDIRFEYGDWDAIWDIEFTLNGRYKATAAGDQFRIFATVVKAIKEWWKSTSAEGIPVNTIRFSADKLNKQTGKTGSREKLYNRFAQQFANSIGFTIQSRDKIDATDFELINPNYNEHSVNEAVESGKELLKIFRNMHHDVGMNKDMDRYIQSHDWELRDFTPDMFPSEEEFFDYDDPFDRVIDVDYSRRVNLSAPIIVGPKFTDGKYSVIDGNHRAAAAQRMGKTIKGYFPVEKTNENFADSKVKYTNPQFDAEWEEAERYPEFVKIGKAAWIELASKGKAVTIKSAKGINNTDAADPDSFKSLDKDKQARALAQLKSGNVEMPIVAVYPDGWKELIGGNTRLTAMLAQDGRATVWAFKVPDEVAELAENFADGKNPGRKGLSKRMGVNTKASVSSLRKTAKNSSGEKQRMAHWLANMKAGRKKAAKK